MNRPTISEGHLSWGPLPAGYQIISIYMRRHESFPIFEVYMTYEEREEFEGTTQLISSGQTGKGNTFDGALYMAYSKMEKRLTELRTEALEWARKSKDRPISIADLDFDSLDLDL